MPRKDYYKVLGVSPDASNDEIRKAYRRLAKKHHPDRQQGSKAAEEKFKEISEAYEVLGDPEKRKQYDQFRHAGVGGGPFAGFGGFGEGGSAWTQQGGIDFGQTGGLGDLFSRIFGGGRSSAAGAPRQRGRDVQTAIQVPFETAARGGKAQVSVPRETTCPSCDGSGAAPGTKADTCPHCNGSGQVLTGQGAFSVARTCPACFGRGRIVQTPCGRCRGTGTVEEPSRVEVTIPQGIEDGQKMRLRGLGEPGVGGAPAGDLLLEVHVAPHARFTRKGRDVYSEVALDMVDAALGTEVDAVTMQGVVTVKVPPGTQPGQRLRIPGFGLETSDGRKGDHYVEVRVRVPKRLTKEQKRLLEELRKRPAAAER